MQAIANVALKKRKSIENIVQLIHAGRLFGRKAVRELYRQSFWGVLNVEMPLEHYGLPVCCNPYELVYHDLVRKGLPDDIAWGAVIFGYRFLRKEGFFETKLVYGQELSDDAKKWIDTNQRYLLNPYTLYSKRTWGEKQILGCYKKYLREWRKDYDLKWIVPMFFSKELICV